MKEKVRTKEKYLVITCIPKHFPDDTCTLTNVLIHNCTRNHLLSTGHVCCSKKMAHFPDIPPANSILPYWHQWQTSNEWNTYSRHQPFPGTLTSQQNKECIQKHFWNKAVQSQCSRSSSCYISGIWRFWG